MHQRLIQRKPPLKPKQSNKTKPESLSPSVGRGITVERGMKMLIFHAITETSTLQLFHDKTGIRLNYLIAFNYAKGQSFKLTDLYRDRINLLYLDSGAYSVSTGKSNIDVHGYRGYLKSYSHKFNVCFSLDDDFNHPDHNLLNQLYLEQGLAGSATLPVPVVHDQNNPFAEFEMYAGLGHSYIAIGSSGSPADKDQLLTQAKAKYPDVKIHLFGDLDRNLLEKYRPYSADSATWAHHAGVGCIYYWQPNEKKQYSFNTGERDAVKGSQLIKRSPLWEEIRAFLYDTFRYEDHDLLNYQVRRILNLYFYKQYEDYLNSPV